MRKTRFCPAKVNLFLEVTGKRPNGYHELATLFAKIDLGDQLTVDAVFANKTSISLQVKGPWRKRIPVSPQNLVYKAAQAFLDYYCLQARVQLVLDKRVPTGAGLGGGSSDAAGVLLCLCEIFHKNPMDLIEVAASLGADVPLFLYPQTFLKGEGIGEKLTPLPAADHLPSALLIYPNRAVSTKQVFSRMTLPSREQILTNSSKLDKLIDAVEKGLPIQEWRPLLFNRLEDYVLPFVPAVKESLEMLKQANNEVCIMSGSGSTVFTLVGTKQHAQELADRLHDAKRLVFPVSFYRGPMYANYGDKSSSHG